MIKGNNIPTKKDWGEVIKVLCEIFAKPLHVKKRKGLWFWK